MTNAELITELRLYAEESPEAKLLNAAADALETAEHRISDLKDDLRNSTISNPEQFKIYNYSLKDLIMFADMCKRNDVQESDLKQAAWNIELAGRAVMNERQEIVKNLVDEITMRFTPDFEKAFEEMKGEYNNGNPV